MFEQSAQQKL